MMARGCLFILLFLFLLFLTCHAGKEEAIFSNVKGISKKLKDIHLLPTSVFGDEIGTVLLNCANELSIPINAVVMTVLVLTSSFMNATLVRGIKSQYVSMCMCVMHIGPTSINKTGVTRMFDYVFNRVRKALHAIVHSSEKDPEGNVQRDNSIYVMPTRIPHSDSSSTMPAFVSSISGKEGSVVAKNNDEGKVLLNMFNKTANGVSGDVAIFLEILGGPPYFGDSTRANKCESNEPRVNCLLNIHVRDAVELFTNRQLCQMGFPARFFAIAVASNLKKTDLDDYYCDEGEFNSELSYGVGDIGDFEYTDNWSTDLNPLEALVKVVSVVAAKYLVDTGSWKDDRGFSGTIPSVNI